MAPQFTVGLSNSYRCFKEQTLNLTLLGKNETVGHLKISDLQFEAFRGDNTTVFGLGGCQYGFILSHWCGMLSTSTGYRPDRILIYIRARYLVSAKDCSFNTPDIVPITVGCALAGLVVIVLIVYLVGRRRSQARGYLSM